MNVFCSVLYLEFLDDSAEGAGSFSFSDYP